MSADLAFILDIVVDQGEIVKQLDRGGEWRGATWITALGCAAKQGDRRPQALAEACRSHVVGDRRQIRVELPEMIPGHAAEQRSRSVECGDRLLDLGVDQRVDVDRGCL